MRISLHDRDCIRQATSEVAGPGAKAMLFGSRTDDQRRGGDIDLLIELPEPAEDPLALSLRLAARIQRGIGLRKIDVLVADPSTAEFPLLRQARRDAVAI
jgi:predicted nucleotidyltransferase